MGLSRRQHRIKLSPRLDRFEENKPRENKKMETRSPRASTWQRRRRTCSHWQNAYILAETFYLFFLSRLRLAPSSSRSGALINSFAGRAIHSSTYAIAVLYLITRSSDTTDKAAGVGTTWYPVHPTLRKHALSTSNDVGSRRIIIDAGIHRDAPRGTFQNLSETDFHPTMLDMYARSLITDYGDGDGDRRTRVVGHDRKKHVAPSLASVLHRSGSSCSVRQVSLDPRRSSDVSLEG